MEGGNPGLFRMRDDLLLLSGRPQAGQMDLTIKAHLSRRHAMPEKTAREEIMSQRVQHTLKVVVMGEDGRQRYPVFERISYEFEVGLIC